MVSLLWCFVLAVLHCGKNDVMGQPQNVGESVGSTMALAPGIFPHLTATADSAPKRSESGTGAMMVGAQITSSQIPRYQSFQNSNFVCDTCRLGQIGCTWYHIYR